jgi:hypothetical protein
MSLDVLTWHIHGSYLGYLAECGHEFYLPVLPGRPPRFSGRASDADWPENIHEIPAEKIASRDFDCVLYQHHENWTRDRFDWLSPEQRRDLPQAFLEHDPPRQHPTDTRHPVDDPNVLIVHCTHFNELMWDCGDNPTVVIEHGVRVPDDAIWVGDLERGIVCVNDIASRGRRLGDDVFAQAREELPLDLYGLHSEERGGLGALPHARTAHVMARYRFLFNPIRYTSLGLSVCEAMMVGVPIVGLATTEMPVAIEDGTTGFVATDVDRLIECGNLLLRDYDLAARLSANARSVARERFGIERFAREWRLLLDSLSARLPALLG